MATTVLTDAVILSDGYNLSGDHNQIEVSAACEAVEDTTFGASWRTKKPGLMMARISGGGFFEANSASPAIDNVAWANLSGSKVVSVAPTGGSAGEYATSFQNIRTEYTPLSGAVGEMAKFTLAGEGTGQAIMRGRILATGEKTSTGSGTAYELGTVPDGSYLYAAAHIYSVGGTTPTLTLKVQSDDAEGFADPTDRITLCTDADAVAGYWGTRVAGEITDTWWRADWTIAGASPRFTIFVNVGIHSK